MRKHQEKKKENHQGEEYFFSKRELIIKKGQKLHSLCEVGQRFPLKPNRVRVMSKSEMTWNYQGILCSGGILHHHTTEPLNN